MVVVPQRRTALAPAVFQWPAHSYLLEHVRGEQRPPGPGLVSHLATLGIYHAPPSAAQQRGKVADRNIDICSQECHHC